MNYRVMRLILFFDLPTLTSKERKAYRSFRNNLVKEGFIMLQESVYSKLIFNRTSLDLVKNRIAKMCPKEGSVMCLTVTEKQFDSMNIFCGDIDFTVADTIDTLMIL